MFQSLINALVPRAATIQTLGHPAAGVIGWWEASDNSTGEPVTEETALRYAAFWCGVRVISELLASLPCLLYRREGENKSRASDDPRYSLVHDAPNDDMDAYHFFEVSTSHQVIYGNSYARILRDHLNMPVSLHVRLPERAEVRDDGVYKFGTEEIEPMDMLHVAGFGHDGQSGYSLVRNAAQSLGIGIAGDKFVGASLKNGAVPSGVLRHPMKLSKPARDEIRRDWESVHSGAGNVSRLAIMHGGMEYQTIAMNADDAQLIEQRKFSVVDIARWLRLPLYILADLENSGVRANIEQQSLDLISYSLIPWVRRWEGGLKMKLLRRDERHSMFFEFLLDSLLRADTKSRFEAHAVARQWGWESVNDILKMENRNTIGPDGDVYLQPMNMSSPSGAPAKVESPAKEVPASLAEEYRSAAAAAINETIETGKQLKACLAAGLVDAQNGFSEFTQQLNESLSSSREIFNGIKNDMAELGQKTQVRVPDVSGLTASMVRETLAVLEPIESGEAERAAKAQVFARKNFQSRMETFYSSHSARIARALTRHIVACGGDETLATILAEEHCQQSLLELLDCADGEADGFLDRVRECVKVWKTTRLEAEAREYHARIYGG